MTTSATAAGQSSRCLVIVIGPGRSGTSTVAGALNRCGLEVPGKAISGNATNPSGFFEPRWVVDFHRRLLTKQGVLTMDTTPDVLRQMARAGEKPAVRDELRRWLGARLEEQPRLVVKDPRIVWFSELWTTTAQELGVEPSFVTMLRHPTEVAESRQTYYGSQGHAEQREKEIRRIAGWVNVVLTAEELTRGLPRGFVPYQDLLADWRSVFSRLERELHVELDPSPETTPHPVDEFIDPSLRRMRGGWDDIDVPAPLAELAEEVWQSARSLAADAGSTEALAALENSRQEYHQMTSDAVALSRSVIQRARRSARARRRREMLAQGYVLPGSAATAASSGSPRLRAVSARLRRLVSRTTS